MRHGSPSAALTSIALNVLTYAQVKIPRLLIFDGNNFQNKTS